MSATVAAYEAVLRQVWTQDRLESQLFTEDPILSELERKNRYSTGKEALVPLHVGRSGGYSVKPASGGQLNGADEQKIDAATYNYTHHYFQIEIESAAVDQSEGGNSRTAAEVVDVEVTGAVADLRKQITRQLVGNGDALIAQCDTTTASATVELLPAGYGFGAIERGHLYPGLKIDIGTTADEDFRVAGAIINSVSENAADPKIVIDSAVTTANTDYISIADARSGATSYEANGFLNISAATGALGGLNPATTGEEFWAGAQPNTTDTAITLPLMYTQARRVQQKTGRPADWVVTSLKQQQEFYELLQAQARFDGDRKLGAGNVGGVEFAGMKIDAQPDVHDRHMFFLSRKHLFIVATDKPHWFNKYTGGKILETRQGYTSLVGQLVYRFNLATNKRNAHTAFTNLTAA
jgi:hypothetical protein